ncbi:conserved hypothetical protein [Ricinus communis]|uniref:Pentatricopeptide repeat-containing protein n=1 Tax=Ricinus communis TaxID=3988 RepID=B9SUF7_RICCO|nr:conserved hypothetical protein [Ricinus communis]
MVSAYLATVTDIFLTISASLKPHAKPTCWKTKELSFPSIEIILKNQNKNLHQQFKANPCFWGSKDDYPLGKIALTKLVYNDSSVGADILGCTGRFEEALEVVRELKNESKNGFYGVMLANIYGELAKWDEVHKERCQNAYKICCSWIDVDNEKICPPFPK